MDISLRTLDASDADAFLDLDDAAFSVRSDAHRRTQSAAATEWPRMHGAFDGHLLCGAAGAFSQTLTLPGGGRVPVAGVTAVGVLPTHRRRGVLTALMGAQLDDVAGRGEAMAVLNASEATIYGRFGYGVATRQRFARVDRARAAFAPRVGGEWSLRLIDDAEAVTVAPALFDAYVASRPGALTRPDVFWPAVFGPTEGWFGGGEHFTVVCAVDGGPPCGYAIYRVRRDGPAGQWVTLATEVIAADLDAEAVLWRFLLDVDLTKAVEIPGGPLDDPLQWRLGDHRAYRVTGESDALWVRILDPIAALEARSYGAPGELVVELTDAFRPATSGRYAIVVGDDGAATVSSTRRRPDVALGVAELGSVYLGGVAPSTLAAAGRVVECQPGAAGRADRMFAAERAPFCITKF